VSEPFIAEIRLVSFNFAPKGWAMCNGQLLPINQNQALFSILGTTYGGNGQTTFALPDLRGRSPVHMGAGAGLTPRELGEVGGSSSHLLTTAELPQHTHQAFGQTAGTTGSPSNAVWADSGKAAYAAAPSTALAADSISTAGGSQPHPNLPPYLTGNFVIAIEGIFPSRN